MKTVLLTLLMLVSTNVLLAQKLNGFVTTASGEKLSGAHVQLYQDSIKRFACQTDQNGTFVIRLSDDEKVKDFNITISYVGYKTQSLKLFGMKGNENLGQIVLQEDARQLKDVVVSSSNQISQADHTLYLPSSKQKRGSSDGIDLINKLMLPGVQVDLLQKTISMFNGQTVLLYINDRKVQPTDVMALRPGDVLRVEYTDNPGLEYGFDETIGAVVKFMTKRRDSGMIMGINTQNALTTGNGDNFFYTKYNRGNSEYGMDVRYNYLDENTRRQDELARFELSDGSNYYINHKGLNSGFKESSTRVNLDYNYYIPQKHLLDITANGRFYTPSSNGQKQKVTETGFKPYYSFRQSNEKQQDYRVDIFYKYFIDKKQTISFNMIHNWVNSDYRYLYNTFNDNALTSTKSSYGYKADGKAYYFVSEALYAKNFNKVQFSAGVRERYNKTDNTYLNVSKNQNVITRNMFYAHAEVRIKQNKFYYAVGISGRSFHFYRDQKSISLFAFIPGITLSYTDKKWLFRYYLTNGIKSSKLAQKSDVVVQQNALEYAKGNPDLDIEKNYYTNSFQINYTDKWGSLQNVASYVKYKKYIGELTERITSDEGDTFWHTYENMRYRSQFSNRTSLQLKVIKDVLSFRFGLNYRYLESIGNNYQHYLSTCQYTAGFDLMLDKWNFGGNWNTAYKNLTGESYLIGTPYNAFYATYKAGDFRLGLSGAYLFQPKGIHSSQKTESQYLNKEMIVERTSWANTLFFTLSWNMQWGKKHKTGQKPLNSSDDSDSGILKM